MKSTLCNRAFFISLIILMGVALSCWIPGKALAKDDTPGLIASLQGKGALPSGLEELVSMMENPVERDKFLSRLKALMAAQEAATAAEVEKKGAPETLPTRGLGKWADTVKLIPGKIFSGFKNFPGHIKSVKTYLSTPGNLRTVTNILIKLALALILGIVIHLIMRRTLRRYRLPAAGEKAGESFLERLRGVAYNAGMDASSALALLIFSYIFVELFVVREVLRHSVLTIFWANFLYSAFKSITVRILSPEDSQRRLIPHGDEIAVYAYIWARRFIFLSVYFYLVINLLASAGLPSGAVNFLEDIYKLVLVIFVAVVLAQWRDTIREKLSFRVEGGDDYRQRFGRTYNFIMGKALIAVPFYIVAIYLVSMFGAEGVARHMLIATIGSVLMMAVGSGLRLLVNFIFNKIFSISERLKERYPGLEKQANRYLATTRTLINAFIFIMAFLIILEMWGVHSFEYVTSRAGSIIFSRILAIAATILIAWLIINLSKFFIHRVLESKMDENGNVIEMSQKARTFFPLVHNSVKYVTSFVAALIVAQYMGLNIMPVLAGAGIVGLAVGFGAQTLVKDVINGFFILFEDIVSVGDVAIINGTGGLVEAVNLRTMKLRDLAGNVHVIPNSSIGMLTNMTKEYSRYVIDVGVGYREDPDEVMQILRNIGDELMQDPEYGPEILEPLEILGVDDFADSAVIIKIRITTKRIRQWFVGRELKRRIKKRFDEKNIEIPFPHRTIYLGDPKHEKPQPLHVKLSRDTIMN